MLSLLAAVAYGFSSLWYDTFGKHLLHHLPPSQRIFSSKTSQVKRQVVAESLSVQVLLDNVLGAHSGRRQNPANRSSKASFQIFSTTHWLVFMTHDLSRKKKGKHPTPTKVSLRLDNEPRAHLMSRNLPRNCLQCDVFVLS